MDAETVATVANEERVGGEMEGHNARNFYVLIAGLQVSEESHKLADGVSLRRLEDPFTVFDLAAAGAAGFHEWAALTAFVGRCWSELESAADASNIPGYDTLNRAWLVSALIGLRGYGGHLCVAHGSYSWRVVAGHQERTGSQFAEQLLEEGPEAAVFRSRRALPAFEAGLLEHNIRMLVERDRMLTAFTAADAAWVREHVETFNQLAAKSQPFRFALEAAVDWRIQRDQRAAVARLWSGIEALFGLKSELVFRLSLLVAAVLDERGDAREKRYKWTRKLYDQRSKAVHGSEMSADALRDAMNGSYTLLRALMLKVIERGAMFTDAEVDRLLTH